MNRLSLTHAADTFAARARDAGHRILSAAPGQWTDRADVPCWVPMAPDGETTPNDLLDLARETARRRIDWVHVVVPTYSDAVLLAASILPTTPVVPRPSRQASRSAWADLIRRPVRGRAGDPRRVSFPVLVDEMPLSVVTHIARHGSHPVNVVEIPAAWLDRPLRRVTG